MMMMMMTMMKTVMVTTINVKNKMVFIITH